MSERKRRKISRDDDHDHEETKYVQAIRKFRVKFLTILNFSKKQWSSIFQDTDVEVRSTDFSVKDYEGIIDMLLQHKDEVFPHFENAVLDKSESDSMILIRVKEFLKEILESTNESDIDFKKILPIVNNFFNENWGIFVNMKLQERRDEETEVTTYLKPITHMKIDGVHIPIDIIYIIMSYLDHNQELIGGLGCVNEKWFIIVLKTWKTISAYFNYLEIPNLVLQNIENIRILDINDEPFWMRNRTSQFTQRKLDLNDLFERLDHEKLIRLDLSCLRRRGDRVFAKSDLNLSLRNLEELYLPSRNNINMFEDFEGISKTQSEEEDLIEKFKFIDLPRLKFLSCGITQLMDFSRFCEGLTKLRILSVQLQQEKVRKCLKTLLERNQELQDEDTCSSFFPNVKELIIVYSSPLFHFSSVSSDIERKFQIDVMKFVSSQVPNCSKLCMNLGSIRNCYLDISTTRIRSLELNRWMSDFEPANFRWTNTLEELRITFSAGYPNLHVNIRSLLEKVKNSGFYFNIGLILSITHFFEIQYDENENVLMNYVKVLSDNMIIENCRRSSFSVYSHDQTNDTCQLIRTVTDTNIVFNEREQKKQKQKEIHIYVDNQHFDDDKNICSLKFGCEKIVKEFLCEVQVNREQGKGFQYYVMTCKPLKEQEFGLVRSTKSWNNRQTRDFLYLYEFEWTPLLLRKKKKKR